VQLANAILDVGAAPAVTPYSEAQWRAIDGLGLRVEADLAALDVRLTQGGEPTFVAAGAGDAPEWNYVAEGTQKRAFAGQLLRRLQKRFAPNGLMLFGQGKWYPGEALPRWALGLYWRGDGAPVWRDATLIAGEDARLAHGAEHAKRLVEAMAVKLGIAPDFVVAAYEDPWPLLETEGRLPEGVDPLSGDLSDVGERKRLARLMRQGLGAVAGYALPLRAAARSAASNTVAWESSLWPLRRERLYLVPGDSPIGYRLPLDTLPADPDLALTALCVEAREGQLRVFLPPVDALEDYFSLVSSVEEAAREEALPILPEGYEPPPDSSVRVLMVTSDPGVIEVNVHPAEDWKSLCAITATVYEEARAVGLVAEKWMHDGRRTGTGGGSHITLGGASPAQSPLLRRPDLLASVIGYWQNHPALSFLFSGQYVGPTSQAPRVDEAREDSLYELEIAFEQLAQLQKAGTPAPATVDRLLRNLLVDVTGNTHRAEFCIDKLASPDGPAGGLGLLELRAFEMAPHEKMAAVQHLLVRALVARFWRSPYHGALVRWGSALHDRFLLPHYLGGDLGEVVAELRDAGYPFDSEWLQPFFDFRFPSCGSVECGGITLELRQALEPWPVLGEAATSSGTSRAVDASMDRLQVKLSGADTARHLLLCNGRQVPLQPAGAAGEQVAGVRYRARRLPSLLHTTIGVHAPLVFDIVDARSARSLGGCTYHVGDPAGRPYETFPENSAEAEARRKARFVSRGPRTETLRVKLEVRLPDAPCTLDLRRLPAGEP
jgi:uncharacterized protein (DUF2126 family)